MKLMTILTEELSFGEKLLETLDIAWKGMLTIFIVIGLIALIVMLLNYIGTRPKKNTGSKKQ